MNCIICLDTVEPFSEVKSELHEATFCFVRCRRCGLIFEKDLSVNPLGLRQKIANLYNEKYFHCYDTGYRQRADCLLNLITRIIKLYSLFHPICEILDYGGGKGYFTSQLYKRFDFVNYYDLYSIPIYENGYNILKRPIASDAIVAIEVVEHFTSLEDFSSLLSFVKENGLLIFTTRVTDFVKRNEISKWWYFNPDAGHMILYSLKSLDMIARKHGFFYFFFPRSTVHVFLKNKLPKIPIASMEKYSYLWLRKLKNTISN